MPQLAVVHTHWLEEHVVPAGHLLLQAPQLFESVVVSTHALSHNVGVEPEQPLTHAYVPPDPEHWGIPLGQRLPHAPQFAATETFVSHPGSGSSGQ